MNEVSTCLGGRCDGIACDAPPGRDPGGTRSGVCATVYEGSAPPARVVVGAHTGEQERMRGRHRAPGRVHRSTRVEDGPLPGGGQGAHARKAACCRPADGLHPGGGEGVTGRERVTYQPGAGLLQAKNTTTTRTMKANIKLELKTLTPVRLATLMGKVGGCMTGNVHFPHPPVPMDVFEAKRVVLWEAITEATEGSRSSKLQRDARGEEAKNMLRQLADYARMVAMGDVAVLVSSGFELARTPQPIGQVNAPLIHEARMTGRRGEVLLRWSGVHGRRGYHVYITDQDPTNTGANWSLIGITGKIVHRVTDLEPYKAYWFSVSAIGPLGESRKSDPALGRAA